METSPVAQKLTRRFMAGETLEDELLFAPDLASNITFLTLTSEKNGTSLDEAVRRDTRDADRQIRQVGDRKHQAPGRHQPAAGRRVWRR